MDSGCRFPCSLKGRQAFTVKIGKVGNPAGASVQLLFEGEVNERSAPKVFLNGKSDSGFKSLDVRSVLPSLKSDKVYSACEIPVPVEALRDGDNELVVGPSKTGLRLEGVELCLQACKEVE